MGSKTAAFAKGSMVGVGLIVFLMATSPSRHTSVGFDIGGGLSLFLIFAGGTLGLVAQVIYNKGRQAGRTEISNETQTAKINPAKKRVDTNSQP